MEENKLNIELAFEKWFSEQEPMLNNVFKDEILKKGIKNFAKNAFLSGVILVLRK